jgi:hypothetical protein
VSGDQPVAVGLAERRFAVAEELVRRTVRSTQKAGAPLAGSTQKSKLA